MASELTLNISGEYEDADDVTLSFGVTDQRQTITTTRPVKRKQEIGTSEEAILLDDHTTHEGLWIRNLDETNYVEIKTGTGGTIFAKIRAGRCMWVPLGSGAQTPFAIANTAAVIIETASFPL
jgi:hypothetical protein